MASPADGGFVVRFVAVLRIGAGMIRGVNLRTARIQLRLELPQQACSFLVEAFRVRRGSRGARESRGRRYTFCRLADGAGTQAGRVVLPAFRAGETVADRLRARRCRGCRSRRTG